MSVEGCEPVGERRSKLALWIFQAFFYVLCHDSYSIINVNIFNIIFMIIIVISSGDGLVGTEEEGEKVH